MMESSNYLQHEDADMGDLKKSSDDGDLFKQHIHTNRGDTISYNDELLVLNTIDGKNFVYRRDQNVDKGVNEEFEKFHYHSLFNMMDYIHRLNNCANSLLNAARSDYVKSLLVSFKEDLADATHRLRSISKEMSKV